jgi:hypothetical protein
MTRTPLARRTDPIGLMLAIANHFISRAEDFDDKVEAAIEAGAGQKDIVALMGLADDARLKALNAASSAAPYVQPRLQAVEFSPAGPATQSRFDRQIETLSDDEVADALRQIAGGTSALALLETASKDQEDEAP